MSYALRMLGEKKAVKELTPGDVLLDFHFEPYSEIVAEPEDGRELYPDNRYAWENVYVKVKSIDPLGLRPEVEGVSVFTKGTTVRVGAVPLKRVKGSAFVWEKPDGSTVNLH